MSEPSCEFDPIDDLADAFLERYRRGERPSVAEYTAKHPALAERLRTASFPLWLSWSRSAPRKDRGPASIWGRSAQALRSRAGWANTSCFAALALAVWESYTRPSTNRSRAAWRSRSCTRGSAPIETMYGDSRPRHARRPSCTTPTSCQSSTTASKTASAITRCSASSASAWSGCSTTSAASGPRPSATSPGPGRSVPDPESRRPSPVVARSRPSPAAC